MGVDLDEYSRHDKHETHDQERAHYPGKGGEPVLKIYVNQGKRHVGDLREYRDEVFKLFLYKRGALLELAAEVAGRCDEHVPGKQGCKAKYYHCKVGQVVLVTRGLYIVPRNEWLVLQLILDGEVRRSGAML